MSTKRHAAPTAHADGMRKKQRADGEGRRSDGVDWGEDSDDELALKTADEVDQLGSRLLFEILGTVRRLRAHFQGVCPYFVSKTLLYDAMVHGPEGVPGPASTSSTALTATDVDVGLLELKQKSLLMAIYLPGAGDEALIETIEYRELVQRVLSAQGRSNHRLQEAVRFFHEEIVGMHPGPIFQLPKSSTSTDHLDVLVKHELVLRMPGGKHTSGVDSFAFKVPGSGSIVSSMVAGRTELVSRIKRKRYHEMLTSKIRKEIKLRKTVLPIEWHIADLVGSGLVHVEDTTVGQLLRLIDD
jgi:hypothetical protein